MSIRAMLPVLCLGLAACQSQNPYTDESAPIPPAPPIEQIQSPVYPAAPRDFSSYQNWSWQAPPAGTASITGEELQEMVAGALDQLGLRP
ncbi:lipoprotein, partial [Stutzerimonas stutzeri]